MRRASLPEWTARRYRRHFECLADVLSLAGLDRLMYSLKRIRFFPCVRMMNEYLLKRRFKEGGEEKSLGMWHSKTGTLFLANRKNPQGWHDSERVIFAHEIAHVIDQGPFRKSDCISDRADWRLAWSIEIDCDEVPLSRYARKSESEGFAEFGALALTDPVLARRAFPMCWAVWRKHHLDADAADAAAPSDRPAVAAQPIGTSDAAPSIAATAADGATAA